MPVGSSSARAHAQQGVALVVALIVLLAVMGATVALQKSVDVSTLLARNTSFSRDAYNRNDLAMRRAMLQFEEASSAFGLLANTASDSAGRATGQPYSARALPADAAGIPLVLKNDADYRALFGAAAVTLDTGQSMSTVYVIERMCALEQPADATHCTAAGSRAPDHCTRCSRTATPFVPVFRVSARTRGPRNTEAFSQTLFTLPIE